MFNLSTFDSATAITLRQAIDSGRLNFRGKKPTLGLIQRWSNPNKGCRPAGPSGPRIVLPTVITGRERLVMPEWVDWFVKERQALLVERTRKMLAGAH